MSKWPELRKIALLESGGQLEDPAGHPGWPMLGPILPRLLTYLGLNVHIVSSQWPHPSAETEQAPWFGAVRHSPGFSTYDGPQHDWNDFLNASSKKFLGSTDSHDHVCHGHFYVHKIKSPIGLANGWSLVVTAREQDHDGLDDDMYQNFWPDLWNASLAHELKCELHTKSPDIDVPVPPGPLLGSSDDSSVAQRRRLQHQAAAEARLRRIFYLL